jgi:hypothetical protein
MINIQTTVIVAVAQLFVGEVMNSMCLKCNKEENETELAYIMENS